MPKACLSVAGNRLTLNGVEYACAIGRNGLIDASLKREGDGCTPMGTWALRECWYRPDRITPFVTSLPLRVLAPDDGWCDDPAQPWYNRHFKIPSSFLLPSPLEREREFSYEHLWREDGLYDFIIPLGYNDDPVIPGKGSAIFLHCAAPDYAPTEGCVALAKNDLAALLPVLKAGDTLTIHDY